MSVYAMWGVGLWYGSVCVWVWGSSVTAANPLFTEPTKTTDEPLITAVSQSHTHSPFPHSHNTHTLSLPPSHLQCLYESISLLDILCSLSGSLIHGVFHTMRKLFTHYSNDPPSHGRLLLALVRFFLHHGQSEMYDIDTPIRAYFGQVLTVKFNE